MGDACEGRSIEQEEATAKEVRKRMGSAPLQIPEILRGINPQFPIDPVTDSMYSRCPAAVAALACPSKPVNFCDQLFCMCRLLEGRPFKRQKGEKSAPGQSEVEHSSGSNDVQEESEADDMDEKEGTSARQAEDYQAQQDIGDFLYYQRVRVEQESADETGAIRRKPEQPIATRIPIPLTRAAMPECSDGKGCEEGSERLPGVDPQLVEPSLPFDEAHPQQIAVDIRSHQCIFEPIQRIHEENDPCNDESGLEGLPSAAHQSRGHQHRVECITQHRCSGQAGVEELAKGKGGSPSSFGVREGLLEGAAPGVAGTDENLFRGMETAEALIERRAVPKKSRKRPFKEEQQCSQESLTVPQKHKVTFDEREGGPFCRTEKDAAVLEGESDGLLAELQGLLPSQSCKRSTPEQPSRRSRSPPTERQFLVKAPASTLPAGVPPGIPTGIPGNIPTSIRTATATQSKDSGERPHFVNSRVEYEGICPALEQVKYERPQGWRRWQKGHETHGQGGETRVAASGFAKIVGGTEGAASPQQLESFPSSEGEPPLRAATSGLAEPQQKIGGGGRCPPDGSEQLDYLYSLLDSKVSEPYRCHKQSHGQKDPVLAAGLPYRPDASNSTGRGGSADRSRSAPSSEPTLVQGRRALGPPSAVVAVPAQNNLMEDAVAIAPAFFTVGGNSGSGSFILNPEDDGAPHTEEEDLHFYGVYDGHGGNQVSYFCADQLHLILAGELSRIFPRGSFMSTDATQDSRTAGVIMALRNTFLRVDAEVCRRWPGSPPLAPNISAGGHLQHQPGGGFVGSTAMTAVLSSTQIVVAHCGDSRAVISRGGQPFALSMDHKPERFDEMQRVMAAGGHVSFCEGYRVMGILAMSRAIGDKQLKPFIIADPEVTWTPRSPFDEFLIIATDGLWDAVPADLACHAVRQCLAGNNPNAELLFSEDGGPGPNSTMCHRAADLITRLAVARGSVDDISVIVVDLRNPSA
eukprot:TRINITY_DN18267_c0_g2_i1.p1 TRINITY_DN18267_c0_g2~~TRINITY_DN18267_c0_g2_i1.p1  ORF type:complete len:976 (+),score=132.88 TRINITY_DN18267_c0_g2_i1:231-3158(+)